MNEDQRMSSDRAEPGHVVELLHWWVNGTLAPEERERVAEHLRDCAACRDELDRIEKIAELHATHPPAWVVVDYAMGAEIVDFDRGVLEKHLDVCASCLDEVERVRAEPDAGSVLDGGSRFVGRAGRAWQGLALAACLLAAIGFAGWWSSVAPAEFALRADVVVAELIPQETSTRGGDGEVVEIDGSRPATLLLVTDRAETFDALRVRVLARDQSGAVHWQTTDVATAAQGVHPLHLGAGALDPGDWTLELAGQAEGDWTVLGTYRLRVIEGMR